MQASPITQVADPSRSRGLTTALHSATLLSLILLGACRDPQITTYSVPREKTAPNDAIHASMGGAGAPAADASGAGGMAGQAVPTAQGRSLVWTAPSTWQAKQGSSMRKATYAIVGDGGASADLAVTAFPGDVGGEVANVNRWRGQVGLPEVGEAEARASIQRIEANGLKIGVVDLVDTSASDATRMLGAWVPYEGATWFFKLLGPDALVAREKPAFLEFLSTIRPPAPATP